MTDDAFDRFLAAELAPETRGPDRAFVARVQARIALDEHLASERRRAAQSFVKQLLALVSMAAAIAWVAQAAPVASFIGAGPGVLVLLLAFTFLIVLLSPRGSGTTFTMLNGS